MTPTGDLFGAAGFKAARAGLLADQSIGGAALRRTLCELSDDWLREVFDAAGNVVSGERNGVALVALGGYGRGELCPGSDLDVMVLHDDAKDVGDFAQAIWYPVWDTGIHLGHSVRSVSQATDVFGSDIETATALLDARFLAGDRTLVESLKATVQAAWEARLDWAVQALFTDAAQRRDRFGDVAFSVEPNLKNAGGGLRDAQIPVWLARAGEVLEARDRQVLNDATTFLADVRVALHRCTTASGDVLHLQEQPAVTQALGMGDADILMTRVAGAARNVAWVLDECHHQHLVRNAAASSRRNQRAIASLVDTGDGVDTTDPAAVLDHLAASAHAKRRLSRPFLRRLRNELRAPVEPWDETTRDAFVGLLGTGPGMVDIVEALDQTGVWERLLPEWTAVRTRAQRTPYHRFTVDRHLLETVSIASSLAARVERGDLLVVSALFHDLGKGRGGDHSAIGVRLTETITTRMGFTTEDVTTLCNLVRHHLLLPQVAVRRDIDDATTIRSVAAVVHSVAELDLLAALTEADARATGPSAWTDWKAGLVHTLVDRVRATLSGVEVDRPTDTFPTAEQRRLLASGATTITGEDRTLTVVAPDRPRLFSRVTGALVLAGLNVTWAAVTTSDDMALEVFRVSPAFATGTLSDEFVIDWPSVTEQVERSRAGRIAVAARVAARASTYRRRLHTADDEVRIRFDDVRDEAGTVESVIEVDAPDRMGVLFAITHALAELDIDIRYARVETMTERVVDSFGIVDSTGAPILDAGYRVEIERAIRFALER